jgi:2-polyprenyl-6-methoxyphenol hydroxylase-like FAD-dependent oxidoreductase
LDHAIAVRRTDLHRVLLDAVLSLNSVQTRFGCPAVSADSAGTVTLRPGGPSGATTTTLEADLVIGADGVSSIVRSTGGFTSRVSAGNTYVRTIVTGRAQPQFEEYWTPLGSFGQAPLGPDTIYFWAAAQTPATADAAFRRDLPALSEQWRRVLPTAGELLDRVARFDDLLVNTVRRVDCRRWYSGRLVLLGDAAHAMPPNLGAGANSALVDGVALAQRLATASTITEALMNYDQTRRPAARRLQNIASILQRLCGFSGAASTRVRDALCAGMTRIPRLTERAILRALTIDVREARS